MSETQPRPSLGHVVGDMAQDVAALAGAVSITAGVGWIYRPAGLIVAGVFLLGAAWFSARKAQA